MNPFEELTELFDGGKNWLHGGSQRENQKCELVMMGDTLALRQGHMIKMHETAAQVIRDQYPERLTVMPPLVYANQPNYVIVSFNDHPDTTYEDIEQVNDKARVLWDEVYG